MQAQTQGKLFIFVGSLGLLIAVYFLISAIIPSTTTENDTQILDEEQILDKEEATQTGDNEIDFENLLIHKQSEQKISVLIPEFLFTSGFEDIAQDIQETLNITTTFITPKTIEVYKEIGEDRVYSGETIDVMMVPVDYIYKFIQESKSIPIAEKISPYFDERFSPITDRDAYTFVPHAIDPAIIFSQDGKNPPTGINDRLDIASNRIPPKKYHIPLVFGIQEQDRIFLKKGREAFSDNFFFFYAIIKHIIQGESPLQEIKTLIDIAHIKEHKAWNIVDFMTITKKLSERNKYCKIYPSICIFSYNFADHRFGFMSDITKLTKYFDIKDYSINPFRQTDGYTARGRGFLIHKSEKKEKNIAHFLEGYIQASLIDINPSLRDNTIPASNIATTSVLHENIPAAISNNKNRSILIGDGETAKIFTKETSILDTIAGEYNPELFLQEFNRKF